LAHVTLPFVRQRYVTTNGIRVFCVEEGDGPLVLLVHGFPEFWWSWRHQLPAIAAAGFRAVAIDLPGYGRSDKPDVVYDEEFLNTCLAGVITGLGHEQAVLAGHDWGGLLVWPFARRFPERTAGIIGVNTPDLPRMPMPMVQMMRQALDPPNYIVQFQDRGPAEFILGANVQVWLEAMFLGPVTRRTECFPPEVIARFVEQFAPIGAVTPPIEYYRNIDRNWELATPFADAKVEAPCLMIMAEHDPVLTPALAEGMEDRVPNLTKVLIHDCGHWTQQEQPEATNTAIVDYLQTLTPYS
jgi:pimeloyl-ACP methyl ester carboxylesterase